MPFFQATPETQRGGQHQDGGQQQAAQQHQERIGHGVGVFGRNKGAAPKQERDDLIKHGVSLAEARRAKKAAVYSAPGGRATDGAGRQTSRIGGLRPALSVSRRHAKGYLKAKLQRS